MQDQLSNPIQFIIDHTFSQPVKKIDRSYCTNLYQKYIAWCENNEEKTFANAILEKKFSQIGINRICLQNNGKREYHYILNRSKIIAKLHESDLGDIEKFFDISQNELSTNEIIDIPIFNMPKTIFQKIILPQLEENLPLRDKKVNKQDNVIQELFDYVSK